MFTSWVRWLRSWAAWGRRRVAGGRFGLPPRRIWLSVLHLEDRTAPAFLGGVTTASGDFTGDGIPELVTGAWAGGGPHVRVLSGADGSELRSFYAYAEAFRGGVNVAYGDVTGDGTPDLITGAGAGGGPHVKVFDGRTFAEVRSFWGYDPDFQGGVAVAAGDLNGDGQAEIVTGAGPGGGPHVKAFDGRTGEVIQSFFAYDERFRGGANVAVGDVTGDGRADVITGAGPGGGPHLKVFDAVTRGEALSVFAYADVFRGGVHVAVGDVDGDGLVEVVTGAGDGGGPHVRAFTRAGNFVRDFMAFGFETRGGVWVTAADVNGDGSSEILTGAGVGLPADHRGFDGVTSWAVNGMTVYGRRGDEIGGYWGTATRPEPLLRDGKIEIPGAGGTPVRLSVRATMRDTAYRSEAGLYSVDDDAGRVDGLLPTDPGYTAAALVAGRRLPLDPSGRLTFDAPAGGRYGYYLIQNGTHAEWIGRNPTNGPGGLPLAFLSLGPTPDGFPHARIVRGWNRFGWEDLMGGGDLDFNDLIAEVRVGDFETPPPPPPAGTLQFSAPTYTVGESGGVFTATVTRVGGSFGTLVANYGTSNGSATVGADYAPANGTLTWGNGDTAAKTFTVQILDDTLVEGNESVNLSLSSSALGTPGTAVLTITDNDTLPPPTTAIPPITPFPQDLSGWTVAERGGSAGQRGAVAVDASGRAPLTEGDSFVTTLSKSFVVSHDPVSVQFTYAAPPRFDETAAGFVRDSFEVALLDPAGSPLVGPYAAGRDSFFNATEGTTGVVSAPGVAVSDGVMTLDLSAVPVGTVATLVFRLVNNDADTGSTVTLSTTALPTVGTADAPVKFFVVDDGTDQTYRYGEEGLGAGTFGLTAGATPSGAASNPAGDKVWIVDAGTKRVSVFGPGGGALGGWTATDAVNPQGVTVDGGTLWLVDRGTNTVQRYAGGALRTSGSAAATDSFALDPANAAPSDLVTDGATVWVTDDATAQVFVYSTAGALLGRWHLDGDNAAPSGITRNPSGGADLWVLDRAKKQVFHYPDGTNARIGTFIAAGTFNLAPGNTSPEGIADPPTIAVTSPPDRTTVPAGTAVVLTGVAAPGTAEGAAPTVVTFDDLPASLIAEGDAVTSLYRGTHGVTFEVEGAGQPVLVRRGGPQVGFGGPPDNSRPDTPAAGVAVGDGYLTWPSGGGTPSPLLIRYSSPVALAGGQVLDIDTRAAQFTVFESDGTPGYYNQAIGNRLDGTSYLFPTGIDPTINDAPEPDLTAAADVLGNWLTAGPPPANGHWAFQNIPTGWPVTTETAVVYEIDGGPGGVRNLVGNFGVDNGLFVWLNGEYKFGALAGGGVGRYEYANIALGDLRPGKNYLQLLREDHGAENGFAVRITGELVPAEGWLVEALSATGQVLDQLTLGPDSPGAGDGRAAAWSFTRATADISAVRVSYVGTVATGADYAIDNVTGVPAGLLLPDPVTHVLVNGRPVQALDAAGSFFERVTVASGENRYEFVATDETGATATTAVTLVGETRTPGSVDASQFVDLTAGFRAEYSRTSYRQSGRELFADITVRNTSLYPAGVPLYVAVRNLSDPAVRVLDAAGTLPDGTPYYDFTGLVTGGARQLLPDAATGTLSLHFANPNRGRFTYDLVFLGVPNRPPAFTSVPELEATVGREYVYPATAADPDGDPLAFDLVSGPDGMSVNPATGLLVWTPTAAQAGTFSVVVRVNDGRGGTAEQAFTVECLASRPNRPPVFTTLPLGEAQAGQAYRYDADAADPDRDTLTYSLVTGFPAGMTIDPTTGVITWTPAFSQIGDADVTVLADDGRGGVARQAFTVCVRNDANRPPVTVSTPVTTATVQRGAVIRSSFDTGLDGWTPSQRPQEITWVSSGGHPGGYLRYTQVPVSGPAYAIAPSTFRGNWSGFAGGTLSFDQRVINPGPAISNTQLREVIISGPGGRARWEGPESVPLPGNWETYTITIREADWQVTSGTWEGVLADVTDMRIKVELFGNAFGSDVSGLDNVVLSPLAVGGYSYDVDSLDPDGGPLTYSLTQKPDGMTIDSATGIIAWTPTPDFAGQSVPVTVRVDDGRGGTDEQRFTVTVCDHSETEREFDPVVEWHKGTFTVRPESNQVMMTPSVIDLNADGTPDIVFGTYNGGTFGANGHLRAVSGRDGSELWTVDDPRYRVTGAAGVAVGDIDGDGRPEIIATHESRQLIAFEHDGAVKWQSPIIASAGGWGWGSSSLADLDHDGTPEIIFGATVLNSDGTIRWVGGGGEGNNAFGPLSLVADLDMDGSPDVVAGRTAYRADGSVFWNATIFDGFPAIGNFDADVFPEVVVVSRGTVSVLEHDGTLKWGPVAIPGGGEGGAPMVADFDNDGRPEIGVAGAIRYVVFETDGTIRWQSATQDGSSRTTGSSVFDFDGDGSAEAVYGDELFLRIYRGSDGTVLYSLPKSSGTTYEYPVIVDVDGDGNAEIVTVANQLIGGGQTGVYVIGDRNNTWVNARKIWNQHTYHITNVNDDGSIPAHEANSWEVYNTYRLNVLTDGFDPRATPDLVVASAVRVGSGVPLTFAARVENRGNAPVAAGATLTLFDGDPAKGGLRVGSAVTTQRLRAGEGETLTVTLAVLTLNDLWAVADDAQIVPECDETNNALRAGVDLDPVNYAPRLWRAITGLELNATANATFRLPLPAVDPDGDAITFSVVGGPDGLMVHPTLGVVAWVPRRSETGSHQVVVKAVDTAGNVTLLPFTVTVATPNTASVFISTPPAGPAIVGQIFEYRVTAQDAEQPLTDLRYSLRDPLPGMAIDAVTGVFTWTPTPTQAGTRTVTVVVSDGAAATEQTFTLNVLAAGANRNPVIAVAAADTSAWLGRQYGAQVSGSDPDGDPVRFELVSGPAGMTVDAETGVIRWTPTAVTTTPLPVEVRAVDGRGGSATVTFSVGVHPTDRNRVPQVVSVPPRAAVHGGLYAYDLVARDPDGDQVLWQLVSAPDGVSLDPVRGTLRWTPAGDQTGTHTITVRALDPLLAAGEQTFTVAVACENQPPNVVSRPPTVAYVNDPYLYAVRAVDAEGDPLVFDLESGPAGMAFLPGTSLLRWTPTAAQAGPQAVVVRVTDAAGNTATQAFTVVVSTEAPNRPPVVTSRPELGATLGRPYSYQVVARDADGDPLTYTLSEKPDGMVISAAGVITWTPDVAGTHRVTVEVTDGRGGLAVQTFTLTARENQAPTLTPLPDATVPVGGTYRALVRATDPENDPLTFALTQAPTGMTIDAQGRISWTAGGTPREEIVELTVADPSGLTVTDEFVVLVVADTQAPAVRLLLSRPRADVGQTVQVTVAATDNVGVASVTLTANGVPVALDAQNRAFFPAAQVGRVTFAAVATDASGNAGTATADLVVTDPTLASDVRADITRLDQLTAPGTYRQTPVLPDTPVTVSYLTEVIGTVTTVGQPLAEWKVLLARGDRVDVTNVNPDGPEWRVIATGTAPVTNGRLATFDPTLLTNDRYVIAVVAYDILGAGYVKPVEVDVVGSAKLGEFRLEFTDLSIPLNGVPVEITRVYDTRETDASKDFGFGWTMGVRDARIRETVPADVSLVPGKSKVYLTAPDGNRVGFTYQERFIGGFPSIGIVYAPYFTADAGNNYALTLPSDPFSGRGYAIGALGEGINPTHYRLTTTDGVAYDYDQFAGLQKIADTNGNTLTFTPTAITHSSGRVIAIDRDGQGRVTAIRLPDGSVAVRYRYDAKGDLVEVKQVTETAPTEKALTSSFTYRTDRPHYLDEYVDANNKRAVKTEYDASGRVVAVTDASGNRAEQIFDPANFAEMVKDRRGNPTLITYDARGNVTRSVQPTEFGDIVTQYEYADAANPDKETKVINGRGFATTRTFDARGNLLAETTADGTTAYVYSAANKLTQVNDPLGRVTAYAYSAAGNLLRVVNPLGDDAVFSYDTLGRVATFEDFAGNVTVFSDYCSCGRPLTTTNPDGSVRRIETNGYSQVTKVTDERGNVTTNEYDQQGRLVRVVDGEGNATRYEYEGTNQTAVIDPLGHVTRYAYDADGRKTRITDAEGGVTQFAYDANGNQETVTDPVGNVTRFVYDRANRVKEEVDPLGASRFFEYDAAGNRTEATDRLGRVRTFEYDPLNRQTAERWLDGGAVVRVIASGYDRAGNLLVTSDPDAALSYTYDPLNRVRTATTVYSGTVVPAVTLTYGYDANGNRTSVVDNTGVRVDSEYDDRNQLASRTWQGGGIDAAKVTFDYFANGERQSATRYADAAGTTRIGSSSYEYWKNGLSKTITHANGSGGVLVNYDYRYDAAGRLAQETHHGNTYAYGYDRTGQLRSVVKDGSPFESFSYDANGNRRTSTGPNGSQTYAPAGPANRLTNDGLHAYTYDAEGNLKTKTVLATGEVTEYTWDHRNRLVKVEQRSAGGIILSVSEYAYDPQGRRIAQTNNGQTLWTVYDREHAWVDTNTSGAVEARYLFGDRIDEILARWKSSGGTAWHLADKLGTVHDVANATGVVSNSLTYSAFGQILSQANSTAGDRFAFTGREWDASIGDYYFRARYYDPTTGRFPSVDPLGIESIDANLYRYTTNAPLNYSDPSGRQQLTQYQILLYAITGSLHPPKPAYLILTSTGRITPLGVTDFIVITAASATSAFALFFAGVAGVLAFQSQPHDSTQQSQNCEFVIEGNPRIVVRRSSCTLIN